MKSVDTLIGLIFILVSVSASADMSSCGSGSPGWWLSLDTQTYYQSQYGGISITTGQYTGCGTCQHCRENLNAVIDKVLAGLGSECQSRGGVVKTESRGVWAESIQPSYWSMSSANIGITCQKWIECN